MEETIIKWLTRDCQGSVSLTKLLLLFGHPNELLSILTLAIGMIAHSAEFDLFRRQRGRVVRAPDLKSVGRGFKSRSDH